MFFNVFLFCLKGYSATLTDGISSIVKIFADDTSFFLVVQN